MVHHIGPIVLSGAALMSRQRKNRELSVGSGVRECGRAPETQESEGEAFQYLRGGSRGGAILAQEAELLAARGRLSCDHNVGREATNAHCG